MRRLTFAALGTVSSLVMIFAYPTSHNAAIGSSNATTTTASAGSAGSTSSTGSAASTEGATTGDGTSAAKTYTGDAVQTQWGVVQVQITVENGKVTASDAIQHPTGGHNDGINAYAVPILNSEAVSAQSANIDSVSGATVTSNGYTESLQSALDAAHL
jgi:uncharacterized protein with FMN-binding domain